MPFATEKSGLRPPIIYHISFNKNILKFYLGSNNNLSVTFSHVIPSFDLYISLYTVNFD